MENITDAYNLYLSTADTYAITYWILAMLSLYVPIIFAAATFVVGKFDPIDGIPANRLTTYAVVLAGFLGVMGILGVVFSVAAAVPPTFFPTVWALKRAVMVCTGA